MSPRCQTLDVLQLNFGFTLFDCDYALSPPPEVRKHVTFFFHRSLYLALEEIMVILEKLWIFKRLNMLEKLEL